MHFQAETIEEYARTVEARKTSATKKNYASTWRIGKHGTVFAREPDAAAIDLYKDVTHLYRQKRKTTKRGSLEWATTLWIEGATVQVLRTSSQVRSCLRKIAFLYGAYLFPVVYCRKPRSRVCTTDVAGTSQFSGASSSYAATAFGILSKTSSIHSCLKICGTSTWEANEIRER
jgi:hypothetical protein